MRLAVVVGGWHWPLDFFAQMSVQASGADLFVIAHRNPDLPIVREEKRAILATASGPLADIDRELYRDYATVNKLRQLEWEYEEAPNTVGDWGFFNQWLERYGYGNYDVILNCHDDTYIRNGGLIHELFRRRNEPWLLLANGMVSTEYAPAAYVRGSFEFWKPELLEMLGGRIDLGNPTLTREGLTDTPTSRDELQPWNDLCAPLRTFMVEHGIADRVASLSPHYRVSPWVIEGERGFVHKQAFAEPWTLKAGLEAYPLEAVAA